MIQSTGFPTYHLNITGSHRDFSEFYRLLEYAAKNKQYPFNDRQHAAIIATSINTLFNLESPEWLTRIVLGIDIDD